jgi:hypothetical protein
LLGSGLIFEQKTGAPARPGDLARMGSGGEHFFGQASSGIVDEMSECQT